VSTVREADAPARRWLELRAAAAALAFLTRIPVGRWLYLDGEDVGRAGLAFPLVGAGVGAAVGGTTAALAGPVSPLLAAGVALAMGAVVTGALHLDGLADTADALGASSRAQALEIMRDHAIGAYGAAAIGLDLLIKAGALAALARHGQVLAVATAAGALSRSVPVVLSARLPYARPAEGAAASLARSGRGWRAAVAGMGALGIAAAVAGTDGLVVGACAAVLTVCLHRTLRRWLGGVTGDVLGAAVELSEGMVLVIAVALVGAG
jgi:adenosylcobinamide-GDP ribazoletransferase